MNLDLDGSQIRAARQLLGWRRHDLAERSGVSEFTIKMLERDGPLGGTIATARKILRTFESAGIEFPQHGRGVGLRDTPEFPGAAA